MLYGPPVNVLSIATNSGGKLGLAQMVTRTVPGFAISSYFTFNGVLYIVGQTNGFQSVPTELILVLSSVDQGATWQIQDQANSPHKGIGPGAQAGDQAGSVLVGNVLTLAYAPVDNVAPIAGSIRFRDFSLVTNTWGVDYGVGGPMATSINQCVRRSNGDLVVIHNSGVVPASIRFSVFTGGAWNAPISMSTNIAAGFTTNASSAVAIDAVDTIHCMMLCNGATNAWFYQQILANNTLGQFFNFPFGTFDATGYLAMANPVIVGNNIVFGGFDITRSFPVAIVGTPLANPVFTVSATIDPGFDLSDLAPFAFAYDGVILWGAAAGHQGGAGAIRMIQTTNANPLLGWTFFTEIPITNPLTDPSWAHPYLTGGLPTITYDDIPPDYAGGGFQGTMWVFNVPAINPVVAVGPILDGRQLAPIQLPNPAKDC